MVQDTAEGFFDGRKAAVFLQRWRADLAISQNDAAAKLDIPVQTYCDYEAGEIDLPVKIMLACRSITKGDAPDAVSLPRDRWAVTVSNMKRYLAGEEIVGQMVLQEKWQELRDFMDLVRLGPGAELAMTDPSLFIMLRKAGTKAYLSGLMMLRGPGPELLVAPDGSDDTPRPAPGSSEVR
jgi:DNA-binding XRE family transcriptional regulator